MHCWPAPTSHARSCWLRPPASSRSSPSSVWLDSCSGASKPPPAKLVGAMRSEEPSLAAAWEAVAAEWSVWARKPGHDSYWRFHKEPFFALLPPPGRLTIDIGCGEGRVARDLKALGHNVVAVDVSPTMVEFARAADPSMQVIVADAARLPFDDGAADLAIAFMSLQDVDDMPGAIHEAGRVVERGGAFCLSIVHPV